MKIKGLCQGKNLPRALFALALALMLAAAVCVFDNYGFTIDERAERNSTLVNYQFILKKLFGKEVRVIDQELESFKDRYYGVALQLPTAFLEHLTHFQMPLHDAFTMRHLYSACLCLAGWACFYFFCQKVFRNDWLALLGFLMVALYPRFFGEMFTNIKDLVFAAICCAELWCIALCLEHEGKWRYEWLAAFVGALCVNTRVLGLMLPLLLFGYRVLRDCALAPVRGRKFVKNLARYAAHLALMFGFYMLITPIAWVDPLGFFPKVLGTFSNYTAWGGEVLFLGKLYPASGLPWWYIPAWIGLTAPLWMLALALVSLLAEGGVLRKKKMRCWLLSHHRYFALCLVVILAPVAAMAVRDTTLYHSWRHMYFLFPPLAVLALFGAERLWQQLCKAWMRAACAALVCVLLLGQGLWIAREHPLEKVYFNALGQRQERWMDRDYWCESVYDQYRYIEARDPASDVYVANYLYSDFTYYYYLTDEQKQRFHLTETESPQTEYIIATELKETAHSFPGFTCIREIRVDGVLASGLYLRDDVLQSRFGGRYPE